MILCLSLLLCGCGGQNRAMQTALELRAALLEQVAAVCRQLHNSADPAPLVPSLEALFGTLRLFAQLDLDALLQEEDRTQAVLAADPGGVFPRMDRETREDYLRRIEILARREGIDFILDPMWADIRPNLSEHVDGIMSAGDKTKDPQKQEESGSERRGKTRLWSESLPPVPRRARPESA